MGKRKMNSDLYRIKLSTGTVVDYLLTYNNLAFLDKTQMV